MKSGSGSANAASWRETFLVYAQWPIFLVFLLGIASGFPLLLTSSTLAARMSESGVDIKMIGLFALVGLPYTFKFLAAPIVDAVRLPRVRSHLGHRKSWCVLMQVLLAGSLLGMSVCDPSRETLLLGVFALCTSTFSAMQDIVIDALRIELLSRDSQGAGAAASVAGYRIGMLLAGAGAFVLATYLPWREVYLVSAAVMAGFVPVTLMIRRLCLDVPSGGEQEAGAERGRYRDWVYRAVVAPIVDFMKRPAAWGTLLFIALFKLGDAMAGSLSVPFYLDMGFSKLEIAAIQKVIGVVAVLVGTFLGGFVVKRMPMMRALAFCGTLQILSNFVFAALAVIGHDVTALTVCICIENVSGGMGTAAFVAFMAQLCNVRFTATQYALLSSISSVGRTLISSSAGVLADGLGWGGFFVATAAFGVPGMVLLYVISREHVTDGVLPDSKEDARNAPDGV